MHIDQFKRARVLPVLILTAALCGCKVQINSDLFVQDIFSDENLTLPMQLAFEVPSCSSDSRSEYEQDALSLFDSRSEAKVVGCDEGLTSFLQIAFTGEISSQESTYDVTIFRSIDPNDESGAARLLFALNANFISRVQRLMSENFASLNYQDVTISATLNNDASGPVTYYASGWVDGSAVQGIEGSLNRRQKVSIQFTDLVSAIAVDGGQPILFYVWPPE